MGDSSFNQEFKPPHSWPMSEVIKALRYRATKPRLRSWEDIAGEIGHSKKTLIDIHMWFQRLPWETIVAVFEDEIQQLRVDYLERKTEELKNKERLLTTITVGPERVRVNPGTGMLFEMELQDNIVLIESIIVEPLEPNIPFRLLIWNREQEPGYWQNEVDLVCDEHSGGRRLDYRPSRPQLYEDKDKSKRLYYGITVEKRTVRFDIDEQVQESYLTKPVSFMVTLLYKLQP